MLIALIMFPFLFYSFLSAVVVVLYCSLLFSFSFDSIDLDFSLFSLGKSCCCLCVEMMRASLLNRLTYTLCFFRASLLLTRALPVLLLLFPMYYRCITSASFILSPSLWCVCVIYITASALERVKMILKIIQTDEIVRQRILRNRKGYTHPLSNREFFRFFVFLFLSVSFRELWHSDSRVEHNREREREKTKTTTFFSLFLKKANIYLKGIKKNYEECIKFK